MESIRIVLVDDSREFLHAAQNYLRNREELKIVGLAGSGEEALQLAADLHPDMILMDMMMPQMNGLEATRQIKTGFPSIRIIILTLHDMPEYRLAAADVGADGFVSKAQLYEQLLPIIEQTSAKA